MWILWIDLWAKRVGLAITRLNIAFPLKIVSRVHLMNEVKQLVREYDIETIVVWLPYDLYGKDTKQLERTKKFIEKLKDIFPCKHIVGHDERYSSFEAEAVEEWHRDDIAAQIILQSYLDVKKI